MIAKRIEAACWAAFHSLWITTLAVVVALLTGAHKTGADKSFSDLLVYVKVNYFQCICTVVTAMSIRASIAGAQSKGTNQ